MAWPDEMEFPILLFCSYFSCIFFLCKNSSNKDEGMGERGTAGGSGVKSMGFRRQSQDCIPPRSPANGVTLGKSTTLPDLGLLICTCLVRIKQYNAIKEPSRSSGGGKCSVSGFILITRCHRLTIIFIYVHFLPDLVCMQKYLS